MRKLIFTIISISCLILTGCNHSDEPEAKDRTQTITLYVDSHKDDVAFLSYTRI